MLKRQPMPQQEPKERVRNFNEVCLGYPVDIAIQEAGRCLFCPKPPCVIGCPVGIDIPGFIKLVKSGDFAGAVKIIKQTNPFPAICGRVCPQEYQCEMVCVLGKKDKPVAIGNLERFVADWELKHQGTEYHIDIQHCPLPKDNRLKIAVVGSGPAGLMAAVELTRLGYKVTVFEALHKPGGVLIFGIPSFRLPKDILERELALIEKMGVEIKTNIVIGKTLTIEDLFLEGYKAIFIGSGAGLPVFMDIPGENLNGIYSANEFLTRVNLMKAYLFPEYATPVIVGKKVVVVGGGDTALDAARTAIRFSPDIVSVIYRRTIKEMPARKEEIGHAIEEGIKFQFLTGPIKFIGRDSNWVRQVECIKMELGKEDEEGRKKPVPVKGSEFLIDADTVIIAIGNEPHPMIARTTPGLDITEKGTIIIDEKTCMSSYEAVFAGGDITSGGATVIKALADGKKAAKSVDLYLNAPL